MGLGVPPKLVRGLVADGVGQEERARGRVDALVVPGQRAGMVVAAGAGDDAVEGVEAPLPGPVVLGTVAIHVSGHVPLARHVGPVAGLPERLGDGHGIGVEVAGVAVDAVVVHHVTDVGLVRVQPGQQRRPRGAAAGGVVELAEAQPARRQPVQVGGGDLAAVATQVREAHVVVEDHDDVGPVPIRTGYRPAAIPWIRHEPIVSQKRAQAKGVRLAGGYGLRDLPHASAGPTAC